MQQSTSHDGIDHSARSLLELVWKIGSVLVGCAAVVLSLVTFALHRVELGSGLLVIAVLTFCSVAILHGRFLHLAQEQYRHTSGALQTKKREFQSIFENAVDAILILDDQAICRKANPAALQLLGVTREQLVGNPIVRYYSSRREFDSSWKRLLAHKRDRGQFELLRADNAPTFVEVTARANFLPGRHLMILRDTTQHHQAEEEITKNLALARSAWRETEGLRQATLALTQDLRMNYVLDTLLQTLYGLVPYEAAQVLLLETDSKLFLAREAWPGLGAGYTPKFPMTLDTSESPVLRRALERRDGVLILDTLNDREWKLIHEDLIVRSWLGVPLISSNRVLGLLSFTHSAPNSFSREHLRVAGSLAIPAAAAIQNARIYERAEIYGTELEHRLTELHKTEDALAQSENNRRASEEQFQRLFRLMPVALSVTTLDEGKFVDVNEAFEYRYGYTRRELIGRTATDLGFWEDPHERTRLVEQLRRKTAIRGAVTRFRSKSGEFRGALYSAECIQLNGRSCLLVMSDDPPQSRAKHFN